MALSFRARLLLIVGTTIVALITIVVSAGLLNARQARDLETIENRLLPKLELGPRLEGAFEHLRQSLQDAVAAQDLASLSSATVAKEQMFELIGRSGSALSPDEAAALRWSIQEYSEVGLDMSRRLISGETGEAIVVDMARMQANQRKTFELIKKTTRLQPSELSDAFASIHSNNRRMLLWRMGIALVALLLVSALSLGAARRLIDSIAVISAGFARFATGEFRQPIAITSQDELGKLSLEANKMASSLEELAAERDRNDWLKTGQAELSSELSGELEPRLVAERALRCLTRRLDAAAGAFYLCDADGVLRLAAEHARGGGSAAQAATSFQVGEGLVGQVVLSDEVKVIEPCPEGYFKVRSGLGEAAPHSLVLVPFLYLGKPLGAMELALLAPCPGDARELLASIGHTVVVALEGANSRAAKGRLLEQAQEQAQRLVAQEEELRVNNHELLAQQERLRHANEELEAQRSELGTQNVELERARHGVQLKVEELAQVSAYKSQFLANMSHELRTPLNSMLLLSHLMAENDSGNLTKKQIEHCRTIHSAGQDLLALINEVLDLSKIEAGREDVENSTVDVDHFTEYVRRVFEPLAADKGLDLLVEVQSGTPPTISTDVRRLERILTNLLGNAVKFTERGQVKFSIGRPAAGVRFDGTPLASGEVMAFKVTDTGVGIPAEARQRIFSPFEQLEAQTSRRYSGTGLGLTISRASAELLGGELRLENSSTQGSTFACYLPRGGQHNQAGATRASLASRAADDRGSLESGDFHLLVIEDDEAFAQQLIEIIHSRNLKALVASTAEEGLALARKRHPSGIILDVNLPDLDGWTVMDRLQRDPSTSSIPVHFVSGVDAPERGLAMGAVGYLTKPATRKDLLGVVRRLVPRSTAATQRVLVVEDVASEGESLVAFLRNAHFQADHVTTAGAALSALQSEHYGCMILDLGLPDVDGLEFLEALKDRRDLAAPKVVIHTGRALTKKETRLLEAYAEAVVLKDGRSPERLLEELRLFVRQLQDALPAASAALPAAEITLAGARILVAEDDMRTVYALSALLRSKGADVLVAETGREALEILEQNSNVECVLMDVMMPEMDGYAAMQRLRADPRFGSLPIIALTAKAMKGERERCLDAGANDYLSKPVDNQRLLEAVQRWWRRSDDDVHDA